MKRLEVVYTEVASGDLEAIYMFVFKASRSPYTALNFTERIRARCVRIGDAPHAGRPRDDLRTGLRTVPFESSAVIAYVVDEARVLIVGVFYGGRDYETLLTDTLR